MGITASFLFKHLRPLGIDGFDTFLGPIKDFLQKELNDKERQDLLQGWITAAMSRLDNDEPFVTAATAVSQGRWSEFYQTPRSTVMFVDAEQLAQISDAAAKAGKNKKFTFNAPQKDPIAVAVTIDKWGGWTVERDVKGFEGATDENGNLCHFAGLLE